MNIIAVDDERPALWVMEKAIIEAVPDCSLSCFSTAAAAVEHAKTTKVDVAFLDIHMAGMDGLELGKTLNDIYTNTNLVFVTSYAEHALEAINMGTSGYIMKPPKPETIRIELNRLRYPIQSQTAKRVKINCFGGFGVFINNEPLLIPWSRPKELLAYLVHKRGAGINNAEIAAVLWADKEYNRSTQTLIQQVISQLKKLLDNAGIGDILIRDWNSLAVDMGKFTCDYYEHLDNDNDFTAPNAGDYMIEYSWSEPTAAYLSNVK